MTRNTGNHRTRRWRALLACAVAGATLTSQVQAQVFEDDVLIAPNDWEFQDQFGDDVAVHREWLAVGEQTDNQKVANEGAVHVFKRLQSGWVYWQSLIGSDTTTGDLFGAAVAFAGDELLVGATRFDTSCNAKCGRVYAFELMGDQWRETQIIPSPFAPETGLFGAVIAAEPHRALVSSWEQDKGVYVLEKGGGTWAVTAKLDVVEVPYALSLDGDLAVIGTPDIKGEVYIYRRMSAGNWAFEETLSDPTPWNYDMFGSSVDLEGDLLAVGEPTYYQRSPPRVGSVFIYERIGGSFQLVQEVFASNGEVYGSQGTSDRFGLAVRVRDGRVFVGAPTNNEVGDYVGAAYLFEKDAAGTWQEIEIFLPASSLGPDPDNPDACCFGRDLIEIEGTLVVGYPDGYVQGVHAGAVHLYERPMGEIYCQSTPNSTDLPGTIEARGSTLVVVGDLRLSATQLPPDRFGMFLASMNPGFVQGPGGSQGNLCLSSPMGRFKSQIQSTGSGGTLAIEVDMDQIPLSPPVAIQPGETWRFQAWFRDANPEPTSNFTAAVAVEFE